MYQIVLIRNLNRATSKHPRTMNANPGAVRATELHRMRKSQHEALNSMEIYLIFESANKWQIIWIFVLERSFVSMERQTSW
jgi:hypothetical protein